MPLISQLYENIVKRYSSADKSELDNFVNIFERSEVRDGWTVSSTIGNSGFVIAINNNLRIVSSDTLLMLLSIARKNGYASLPSNSKYSEIWVVKLDQITECNINSNTLAEACLGNNYEEYLKSVRSNIRDVSGILKKQMSDSLKASSQPESVIFEFANVCNLACPICPRNERKISDGLMNLNDAKKIINDIVECNDSITFYPNFLGEPLIHPDFLPLIDYALGFPNLSINIISNGILLDSRMTTEMLSRPLKNFHFSLHECDTFEQKGIHPRNAISAKNVLNFLIETELSGQRNNIWVGVSMCPVMLNEPAVEEFRTYWQEVVDAVNIYCYMSPDRSYLDEEINKSFEGVNLPCTSPWKQPVIAYDGTVLPCCWDYDHTMPMGNAFHEEFNEIYNGEDYLNLRNKMLSGDLSNYPTCSTCKKWLDYLPAFPEVDMGSYKFSSNGLYLSFATKKLKVGLPKTMLTEMDVWDKSFVPFHRKPRPQARKSRIISSS